MNVLSLFSGIGGIDLGLERAGMRVVGQCEIEPFPREVLKNRWPGVYLHDDVCSLTGDIVRERCGSIDLVAGGFPCQDISSAGRGDGINGARSGLWWEMLRVIREVQPTWVLAENVAALRVRGADEVITSLEECGYEVEALVVGAWAIGAPHKRERVWIVGRLANGEGAGFVRAKQLENGCEDQRGGRGSDADAQGQVRSLHDELAHSAQRRLGTNGSAQNPGHADERGEGMADGDGEGLRVASEGDAGCECNARWHSIGYCGTRLADCDDERLQELGLHDQGRTHLPDAAGGNRVRTRWPSRPGEPQHEWEAPRLVEFDLGSTASRLSGRLVRFANRNALKAYGNAVVPQIVEEIGRAINEFDGR